VLDDGRRFFAAVIARDERRQLALLKIEAPDLPCFSLGSSEGLQPGDWLVSAANPFKVADGPEAVSTAVGVFSGRAPLVARRRKQDYPYDGEVLLVDVLVSTPGSAGGALVDAGGRLVGILGKQVTSTRTNTWLNYAMPVEEVAAFVANPQAAEESAAAALSAIPTEQADLGILLFNVGGRQRPAYVERVRGGSPAALAGVATDDLILSVAGQPIATCEEFFEVQSQLRPQQEIELLVKRGEEVLPLLLTTGAKSP
jgi:serine protease Do